MKKVSKKWFCEHGYPPKGMTVDPYDVYALSEKAKTIVAMATYPLVKRRTIYILLHFAIMIGSLIAFIVIPKTFDFVYAFLIISFLSLALGLITMILAKNMLKGFKTLDGESLLNLSGFTKFLISFARIVATVWGFIAQLIMLMLAGSTTVSGAVRLYVPQGDLKEAYETYSKEFC